MAEADEAARVETLEQIVRRRKAGDIVEVDEDVAAENNIEATFRGGRGPHPSG